MTDARLLPWCDRDLKSRVNDIIRSSKQLDARQTQVNVLERRLQALSDFIYSAISQKDAITVQSHTLVAQQSQKLNVKFAAPMKQDSISMLVFTFIAAVFLPGTFLASFLPMTMVDWTPQSSQSGASTTSSSAGVRVSRFYWVFWASLRHKMCSQD